MDISTTTLLREPILTWHCSHMIIITIISLPGRPENKISKISKIQLFFFFFFSKPRAAARCITRRGESLMLYASEASMDASEAKHLASAASNVASRASGRSAAEVVSASPEGANL